MFLQQASYTPSFGGLGLKVTSPIWLFRYMLSIALIRPSLARSKFGPIIELDVSTTKVTMPGLFTSLQDSSMAAATAG